MPWLTPDSIPEGDDCRPLSIPADSVWLALVSGALTELTLPYNWQKFGTLTVQETVDKMQSIIDNYYNVPCAACEVPGGYPVVRINIDGHLEELGSDGTWQPATGDYLIPPPDARTEGTAPDQNCLAAKNATNALFQLYESLSDSFASELTADQALVAFIAAAVAAIGFEFAPITFAIAAIAFVIFEALFSALQYITADLWTEAFTEQFTCLLLGCVINTDGVVTFDWDCFNAALLAQVNSFGLSEVQMRLYVQIGYILYFIGGSDGLNLAGRTTAITNDDCSACAAVWTYTWDFTLADGDFTFVDYGGDVGGTWIDGSGWEGGTNGANGCGAINEVTRTSAAFDIPSDCVITDMSIFVDPASNTSCAHIDLWIGASRSEGLGRAMKIYQNNWSGSVAVSGTITEETGVNCAFTMVNINTTTFVQKVIVSGTGTAPDFTGGVLS